MKYFDRNLLKQLYIPAPNSHKGQNGKLMIIAGSELFHGASLWPLEVASRIVDMVFYSSVPINNEIVKEAKARFYDGIVVPRDKLEDYIEESDCILIGSGMVRSESIENYPPAGGFKIENLTDINRLKDEGEQTYALTNYLLTKFPNKKWVIDAGALQMIDLSVLKTVGKRAIVTPNPAEFERVFRHDALADNAARMSKAYGITLLLKGHTDVVCCLDECITFEGGNPGMTKGGTGDVLSGLVAALYCKNPAFVATAVASFINKQAGEELYKRVGNYFNASDLAGEIPKVMQKLLP
ncbi:MAG: NAD(P)H-hydrate dehydratase [Candidatus Saccharimonadales bacterium]